MVVVHTTWTVQCKSCHGQMGEDFDNEGEAIMFAREFPLCSECDKDFLHNSA